MKIISDTNENFVISTFLRTEISSLRFSLELKKVLKDNKIENYDFIMNPKLENEGENKLRAKILGEYRGFGIGKQLFSGFPKKLNWYLVEFTYNELTEVYYIHDDYWIKFSNGTKKVKDCISTLEKNIEIDNWPNTEYYKTAELFKQGYEFEPIMLVSKDLKSDIVVFEGHLRLTSYIFSKVEYPLTCILGISPEIINWLDYTECPNDSY